MSFEQNPDFVSLNRLGKPSYKHGALSQYLR